MESTQVMPGSRAACILDVTPRWSAGLGNKAISRRGFDMPTGQNESNQHDRTRARPHGGGRMVRKVVVEISCQSEGWSDSVGVEEGARRTR